MAIRSCSALVVDDDETIRIILGQMLLEGGIDVHSATSAEHALEIYAVEEIDVVITDIKMGGMSGFDLLKRLKLLDPSLKVIIMTSFNSYESVLEALQLGAYDYIEKPIKNHPAVVATVQRAYESGKLMQENMDLLVQLKESHDKLSSANRNLKDANRKLKKLALTDGLTGLYNRRFFDQVLEREMGRRNRYRLSLSLIMIDIDNFKEFNDQYGHSGGDLAIRSVANVLSESARTTDIVARYGGEEFVVILPLTDPENSKTFAERVRSKMQSTPIQISEDETTHLTLSIGISGVDAKGPTLLVADLVRRADEALYKSKQMGKNQYQTNLLEDDKPKAA